MNINAGGWILILLVCGIGILTGLLASTPRIGRCKAEIQSVEHGVIRCKYRSDHMQRQHFWQIVKPNERSSVEWWSDDSEDSA